MAFVKVTSLPLYSIDDPQDWYGEVEINTRCVVAMQAGHGASENLVKVVLSNGDAIGVYPADAELIRKAT